MSNDGLNIEIIGQSHGKNQTIISELQEMSHKNHSLEAKN
jgi:hypothetical protein